MPSPTLTRHQTLVLNALQRANEPTSAYALLEQLHDEGIKAPPQVYRALDKLVSCGLAHKLDSLNAFVACAHPHEHEHGLIVFAICGRCGTAQEFSDQTIERHLKDLSQAHAFRMESSIIEMRGTCEACLNA
ncbi:Fur family transcriptional regulator [Thauera sp. Sel9]|uniref:Fur family transcriptional regulator n=1 Tax=Thauera sp. Sel9 TaxID=2974299 RepID=UPI0021E1894B|nr:Fur family transcriptional regulator [Thauera sp. Sel9]MCV2216800.1 transcriptional repressor [Thauera sp. Sel9]